ncbi:MAG: ATP synthase F0 subunit B [Mailhella sp.]|nr:ATP synthase F0 subunit B [Mailhella sp.]
MILGVSQPACAGEGHGLAWGDFLLRAVNFAVFAGIIWYAAGKLIKKFFVGRREEIVSEMDALAQQKKEAEARLADVEQRIANVEAECDKLLNDGRAQAERMKQAILEDARKQAAQIVEQATRIAEQQGKAELDAIRSRMAESIVGQVEKELAATLDPKKHVQLIEKSLSKVVLQ